MFKKKKRIILLDTEFPRVKERVEGRKLRKQEENILGEKSKNWRKESEARDREAAGRECR